MRSLSRRRTSEGLVVVALGANLGDREAAIRRAVEALGGALGGEVAVAPLYVTAPISPIPQREFFNTVLIARHSSVPAPGEPAGAPARRLLALAKRLETAAGRRPGVRHGPRPLDVDLLFVGRLRWVSPELTLPHPELHRRAFVVVPLADLMPRLRLPPDGRPAAELAAELAARQEIRRLAESDGARG